MKRFALTVALVLTALMTTAETQTAKANPAAAQPQKDSEGHTLVALWKTFYKAQDADLPQDEAKALEARGYQKTLWGAGTYTLKLFTFGEHAGDLYVTKN